MGGGSGGHMFHPFDCPDVNSGKGLMDFFDKSVAWLQKNTAALKIDGANLSPRLHKDPNMSTGWRFVVDRGSASGEAGRLDFEGVTADNAHKRFVNKKDPSKPHGMVGATAIELKILNSALPALMPELKELGFLEEGGYGPLGLYFNVEFVWKKTNVKEYPFNFIAIHGVRKYKMITPKRRGFDEVPVSQEILDRVRDKLIPYALKNSPPFKIFSRIPTKLKRKPNFEKVYSTPIPINTGITGNTKSLKERLLEVEKSPYGQKIVLKEEVAKKLGIAQSQDPFAKKIYLAVFNNTRISDLVAHEDHIEPVVDAFVLQHTIRLIGNEILDASSSEDFGSAGEQEGIVVGPDPDICGGTIFKYTGDFIVGGLASSFKSHEVAPEGGRAEEESTPEVQQGDLLKEETSDWDPEPTKDSPIKKVIAIYPGRFQPGGRHHAAAWSWLQTMFGAEETFLATSNITNPPDSPFSFHEKQEILKAHGIPDEKIVQTKNPYKSDEVSKRFDPDTTAVVFMVGEKDMKGDPRFENVGGVLKSGKPAYYKDFRQNKDTLEPLSKHGYLITAPHISLNVPGHGEMSGTTLRNFLKNATAEQFSGIMGWYDQDLYNMIQSKLKMGDAPPKEGELNENFLSMDSLYSLVDEALHKKYENVYGLSEIISLVDETILEREMTKGDKNRDTRLKKKMDPHKEEFIAGYTKKGKSRKEAEGIYFATIRKRAMTEQNNINETSEEELNTYIKAIVAKLLSGNVKNMDADTLADIGEPLAADWTEQMKTALEDAQEEKPATATPEDVSAEMTEVSGVGGGGVAGFAGPFGNKKRSRSWQDDK